MLTGPEGSAPQMLQMLGQLQSLFGRHERSVERLSLSGRGSWRADLDGGAAIELGRGSPEEVLARARRFVETITQVTGHFKAPVLHADLRHPDGYAVRLRNVTIASPATAPPGRRKPLAKATSAASSSAGDGVRWGRSDLAPRCGWNGPAGDMDQTDVGTTNWSVRDAAAHLGAAGSVGGTIGWGATGCAGVDSGVAPGSTFTGSRFMVLGAAAGLGSASAMVGSSALGSRAGTLARASMDAARSLAIVPCMARVVPAVICSIWA